MKSLAIFLLLSGIALAQGNYQNNFGGSSNPSKVYYATSNGLVCNGSTDDTAALNTLLTTVMTAGGGTIAFPITVWPNRCLFNSAEITIPNNADAFYTMPTQNPLRLTCDGPVQSLRAYNPSAPTVTLAQLKNACVLDLTFNATHAKLLTYGIGQIEVDHLTFADTGSDCGTFWFDSGTTANFHDNTFLGSTPSSSPTYSCNDGIWLGNNNNVANGTFNSWFQGYGGKVVGNWFSNIQAAVFAQSAVNGMLIAQNTIWSTSGDNRVGNGAAINLASGTSTLSANQIEDNVIEIGHYRYGVRIGTNSANMHARGNTCYDPLDFSSVCVYAGIDTGSTGNVLIGNYCFACNNYSPSDIQSTEIDPAGKMQLPMYGSIYFGDASQILFGPDMIANGTLISHNTINSQSSQTANLTIGLYTDNFTRANANPIGFPWRQPIAAANNMQIATNVAEGTVGSAWNAAIYANYAFSPNQYSQVTVGSIANASSWAGPAVRAQVKDCLTTNYSFYALQVNGSAAANAQHIVKRNGCTGAASNLTSFTHAAPVATDVLLLTASGTTITAFWNGVQVSQVTDATYNDGIPGMFAVPDATLTDATLTAWTGGSLTAAGAVPTFASITTNPNCAAVGTAANPSVASCVNALAGTVSCSISASTGTCTVNTTAVTANSEIFLEQRADTTTGTRLGVTCNTTKDTSSTAPQITAVTAGTSFTFQLGTIATNPECFSFHILN